MYSQAVVGAFVVTVSMATSISSSGNASFAAVTIQDWITEGADIVFVTFSKEPMIIACCKFITSKFTVWTWNDRGLPKLVLRNRILSTPTVMFEIVSSRQAKGLIDYFASSNDTGVLTHWVLLSNEQDFNSHAKGLEKSAIHIDVSAISVDQMSSPAFLTCKKGLTENRCSLNTGFVSMNHRSHTNIDYFSGEKIRVGCMILGDYDTCKSQRLLRFMSLLSLKNVSLQLATYRRSKAFWYDIYANKIDVGLVKTVLRQDSFASLSFADISFSYGTLYALDNRTRVVSLLDALCGSNSGILASFSLILCAIAAAVCVKQPSFASYLARAANEGFHLLAPLLNISSRVPIIQRTSISYALVYSVWIVAILPFSVYFRSTLTSLVTVRRPADVLDTLGELESGLDAGSILPCVREGSSAHTDLKGTSKEGGVLLRKLRAAYRIHMRHGLLRTSAIDCFRCATIQNHVCFTEHYPICMVKNLFSEIGEFKEPFIVDFSVFPIPKESRLTRPFKHYMNAVREGSLIVPNYLGCDRKIANRETSDDLFPFLANWFLLLCTSGVVLILEIVVACFSNAN